MVCKKFQIILPGQPDYHDSNRPATLKWFRLINLPLNLGHFLYFILYLKGSFFLYLSYWGVLITFIYFFLSVLSYQARFLKSISYLVFEIIWPLNIITALLFWLYIFPSKYPDKYLGQDISAHFFPILVTIIEFFLSKIIIFRQHYIVSILFLGSYLCFILIPYTLAIKPLYSGITFKIILQI